MSVRQPFPVSSGGSSFSTTVPHTWTAEQTFTPSSGNSPSILIDSAASTAAPVLEFKSNGSQVAYISDLGNTFFQQGAFAQGISTTAIQPYSGSINVSGATFDGSTTGNIQNLNSITGINVITGNYFSASNQLEMPTQGTSHMKWQSNSHLVNWYMGNQSGGDQDWYWPGDGPGASKGMFLIDNSAPHNVTVLDLSGSSGDYLGGDGSFHAVPSSGTPTLAAVMATGNDASGYTFQNTGSIYPASDNSYDIGSGMGPLRYANINAVHLFSSTLDTGQIAMTNGSGELALGSGSTDRLRWYAGDTGSSPSNPLTPVKWIEQKDSSGTGYFMPLYQ